jgi:hypothetical protein
MIQQRTRTSSPARWMKAAARAISEGVQVRQLAGSGQWIASSGSDASAAYEVAITGNVAHGCGCLAGLNDDPVCKHRAAFYLLIGALDVTPEPDPPALGATPVALRGYAAVDWDTERQSYGDDAVMVACAGCGDPVAAESPSDDASCAACAMPAAEVAALRMAPSAAASTAPVVCFRCRGASAGCLVCQGAGVASLVTQAAALRAAA